MNRPTVPWVPWLEDEHIPGEVVWLLYTVLVVSHEHMQRGRLVTGSGLVTGISKRTGLPEGEVQFYVHMALELGLVGGIEIATGHKVTVEHVTAAEAADADPRVN